MYVCMYVYVVAAMVAEVVNVSKSQTPTCVFDYRHISLFTHKKEHIAYCTESDMDCLRPTVIDESELRLGCTANGRKLSPGHVDIGVPRDGR